MDPLHRFSRNSNPSRVDRADQLPNGQVGPDVRASLIHVAGRHSMPAVLGSRGRVEDLLSPQVEQGAGTIAEAMAKR
jgi:hypothetical protein